MGVNETNRGAQKHVDSIPIDHEFDNGEGAIHRDIDPSICCHVYMEPNEGTGTIPEVPPADHLIVWEANIKAFSLRLLTKESDVLDWVVLMQGPGKLLTEDEKIGGFWSGAMLAAHVDHGVSVFSGPLNVLLPSYLSLFGAFGVAASVQPMVKDSVQTGWQFQVSNLSHVGN